MKAPTPPPIPEALLRLALQPGARETKVRGMHGDRIKIAVAAPAQDGRANAALVDFLAERLRVSKRSIEIVSGQASRLKNVRVRGITVEHAAAALLAS